MENSNRFLCFTDRHSKENKTEKKPNDLEKWFYGDFSLGNLAKSKRKRPHEMIDQNY